MKNFLLWIVLMGGLSNGLMGADQPLVPASDDGVCSVGILQQLASLRKAIVFYAGSAADGGRRKGEMIAGTCNKLWSGVCGKITFLTDKMSDAELQTILDFLADHASAAVVASLAVKTVEDIDYEWLSRLLASSAADAFMPLLA